MTTSRAETQSLLRQWREVMASSRPHWSAGDLTLTQLRALSLIGRRGAARVSDLAEDLGVGLAAASSLADRMAQRKFITRRSDASDRRIVLLQLGARGRQLLDALEQGSTAHVSHVIERMTGAEREALAVTLRAFVRLAADQSVRKTD